ncbi:MULTISPECIES: hypothetical protein [unclassified Microcoleus]|nr:MULTISPECIES: hypothetical protein [unclassified Microcoleus]
MLELENKNQNLLDLPNPRSPVSPLCWSRSTGISSFYDFGINL